jgi:hypothetical protein
LSAVSEEGDGAGAGEEEGVETASAALLAADLPWSALPLASPTGRIRPRETSHRATWSERRTISPGL